MAQVHYKKVPDTYDFFSLNEPEIGTALKQTEHTPILFKPLTIRGVTFKNRVWVSPMCQYSSEDGKATDWHLVHHGGFAVRGVGSIMVEATAVVPEGRISPQDMGLWSDEHIAPLKRVVDFVHTHGTKIGIQLAHAGRKASTYAPFVAHARDGTSLVESHVAPEEENGWPTGVYGPSTIRWSEALAQPNAMTLEDIQRVKEAFLAAAKRAEAAGFDFIEIHAAHGYLFNSFMSPLSNDRTDQYGGSFENRIRLPIEVAESVRAIWNKPLFLRLSATEWAQELGPEKDENGEWKWWGPEQSVLFSERVLKAGVDLLDVSSGGNYSKQKITVGPGYQVPFAAQVKAAQPDLLVGAVGMITDPKQAEEILQEGKADVVFLARELLRRVDFPLIAAHELGAVVKPANQYELAWSAMLRKSRL